MMQASDKDDLQSVIEALRPLLSAALREGGRLPPERSLAERLGIPRRQLRMALDALQQSGVVFRRHGRGTFVVPPPHPDRSRHRLLAGRLTLNQLMDVRYQVEPRLAELAAIHCSEAEKQTLGLLMQKTRDATRPRDYDLADAVFHYRIAELSQNALFLEIYELIREFRRDEGWRERRAETNVPEVLAELGQQHQRIFDAIARSEPEEAGAAVRDHLGFVASKL
ncbi:DNA-binding transcriptional regulator, FadR family [Paracoccus isoporae]|uniref:DNA-binding transcriptional regulator, FadR family n=1 Tax=Paracoccus isoporae TaxID=591205 RepID=A0A1G6ZH05_9RHOB|nr:FCD domain-containing protein [Paracoccus isoporae]SDE01938.1 DNA-binding transcriptional regulator, FadR family [Paracoccus isoporae]